MFDETETERVRKLAKSIRKNNEAKQSLLKLNYHSKPNNKKSVNSSGNNTTGNSSNSKYRSGSNGRSNNFNGSPSNVASGSNNTKSANGTNNRSKNFNGSPSEMRTDPSVFERTEVGFD
ncbi:hypothetical protein ACTFIR_009426 [Dictyostelium discoideum]